MSEEREQALVENEAEKTAEATPADPQENTGEIKAAYQNKQEDLMAAIEAIDIKNKEGTRKTIHIMAVVLVGYWAIESIIQTPSFFLSWVMLAIAAALGVYVWREPRCGNLKYSKHFVERAPEGVLTINQEGIFLEDGTGREPFLFSAGIKIYRYKNVLAVSGKKRRLAMIPFDQFSETQQAEIVRLLSQNGEIETLEEKQTTGGFFKK